MRAGRYTNEALPFARESNSLPISVMRAKVFFTYLVYPKPIFKKIDGEKQYGKQKSGRNS